MASSLRTALLATSAIGFLLSSTPAMAASSTADAIKALQEQVNALQKQLADMQTKEAARAQAEAVKAATPAPVAVAAAAPAKDDKDKKEILPGVTVKLGGYIAMEGLYRSKNQASDMSSGLNTGMPFANSTNAYSDEFRGSARQTRLSLLMEGKPDNDTALGAYVETDFMGSGSNSSSVQSNNYTPRLRHAYMTVDREDWGFHFLGGQNWTLASLYKKGLTPRQEAGVATIDSAGPPGYVWTRAPQIRFVKDFDDKNLNVGLSFESPQINMTGLGAATGITSTASGLSADVAPDVIAKIAYDTSFGHYEIFGLTRFFRDVVSATGENNYAMGVGGGLGAFIPVVPKILDIQANVMAGKGIGRYSSAQLPDIAFTPEGGIKPLTQMTAMVGLIGHATPTLDLYLYGGAEKILRQDEAGGGNTYGYGNSTANNALCYYLNGGTCQAQTKSVWQISPGFWNTVYKGVYGNIKVGGQYSLTRRDTFTGINNQDPHVIENTGMLSIRYAPF